MRRRGADQISTGILTRKSSSPARQRHVHGRRRDDRGEGWPSRGGSCRRGAQVHELGDRAAPSGGHARERAVRHRVAGGLTRPSRVTVVPWRRSPPAGSLKILSPLLTEVPRRAIVRTSENAVMAKFAEFPFHALGRIAIVLRNSASQITVRKNACYQSLHDGDPIAT